MTDSGITQIKKLP